MKQPKLGALTTLLLLTLSLSACQPDIQNSTSISTTETNTKESTSSTSPEADKSNESSKINTKTGSSNNQDEPSITDTSDQNFLYDSILTGDFSLIAGTWENQQTYLMIASDGSVQGDLFLTDARLDGEVVIMTVITGSGIPQTLYYVPANIKLPSYYFNKDGEVDDSDTSRERLFLTKDLIHGDDNYKDKVFYSQ
ncbi:DUF6287 domain-containing protein [Streptococcus henryi]|uniref:DUF6287 domain-containing protein n=1 Tax=Streptococcus henryi TaxID=439219 RepID=UPI000370B337|nr:DUF6287 domain-containing protein [Streptococcus henryi]